MAAQETLLISESDIKQLTDINENVSINKFKQYIAPAQRRFVIPIIGKTCYDELIAAIDADTLSAAQTTLLTDYIKRGLAWWVLYMAYPNLHSSITSTGIHVRNPESSVSVDSSILKMRRESAKGMAEYWDEQTICYLSENTDTFPCYNEVDCCEPNRKNSGYSSGIILDDVERINPKYPWRTK